MADAGYPQVRLLPSFAKAGEDGSSVNTTAGTLEFVKHDEAFGASNPQGFSGGGFSIGGAEAFVATRRCSPDCGGGTGDSDEVVGGDTPNPIPNEGAAAGPSSDPVYSDPPAATAAGTSDIPSTYTTDTSGGGLGAAGSVSTGSGGAGATAGSGSTTAATPPSQEVAAGVAAPGAGVEVQQQAAWPSPSSVRRAPSGCGTST